MINVDFVSPALWLGVTVCFTGLTLYLVRLSNTEGTKDAEIVTSALLVLCGGILAVQGWRLDPILLLSEFVLTSVAIFYIWQTVQLRKDVLQVRVAGMPMSARQQYFEYGPSQCLNNDCIQCCDARACAVTVSTQHAYWLRSTRHITCVQSNFTTYDSPPRYSEDFQPRQYGQQGPLPQEEYDQLPGDSGRDAPWSPTASQRAWMQAGRDDSMVQSTWRGALACQLHVACVPALFNMPQPAYDG